MTRLRAAPVIAALCSMASCAAPETMPDARHDVPDARAPDAPGLDAPSAPDAPSLADASTDAPLGPTMELTFQQGVAGYAGTSSVGISTYNGLGEPGEWNANGATFADGQNDWCTGSNIPPSPYGEVWLLRFDALDVPAGARVVEATLEIWAYGNDTDTDLFLDGRYLAVDWFHDVPVDCAGCSSAPVGWRYRDTDLPWAGLGASGEGADTLAGAAFRVPETGSFELGSTPRPYRTRLDPDVVQTWLEGRGFGLRLVGGVPGVHHGYVQPERDETAERPASMRPRLTLRVTLP